ncbi:MAG: hypothetical protein K8T90_18655 [Planctomycetes bacterium]|nr:hypothetical protein [Planctomycetota bacterium]
MSTTKSLRTFACALVAAVIGLTSVPAFATGPDGDGDGISNLDELTIWSSSPTNTDSDGDSLSDGAEVLLYGTSPTLADTDGDGTPDNLDSTPTHFNGTTYGGGNNATFTNGRTGTIGAVSGLSPYGGVGVLLVEGSLQYDFSVGHAKGVASLHHALGLHYDSQSLWNGHHGMGWVSILDTQRTVFGSTRRTSTSSSRRRARR